MRQSIFEIDFELRIATGAQGIYIERLVNELREKRGLTVHVPQTMNMKQARTVITFLKQKLTEAHHETRHP